LGGDNPAKKPRASPTVRGGGVLGTFRLASAAGAIMQGAIPTASCFVPRLKTNP
jgi:hypothetical protein